MSDNIKLLDKLAQHRASSQWRTRISYDEKTRASRERNFSSNDYLGLSQASEVIHSFKQAADTYGVGGESSLLVSGYTYLHREFEEEFADFFQKKRALLFSCGYMANLGLFSVLLNNNSEIFSDKYIHASCHDGIRLAKSLSPKLNCHRYNHLGYDQLNELLTSKQAQALERWIITDGVFSMHGDFPDLSILKKISHTYRAKLFIDDAHGFGVLGRSGRGIVEHFNLSANDIDCINFPLAKALGVMGSMVIANDDLLDALIQFSRPYTYTTALPPAFAAAGLASLNLMRKQSWRREKLTHLINYTQKLAEELNLPFRKSITAIQTLMTPSTQEANHLANILQEQGFLVKAMRPPTVPKKDICLRISITALHEEQAIHNLLTRIKKIKEKSL
jgi:8-amino-7-oxononanoate synthase